MYPKLFYTFKAYFLYTILALQEAEKAHLA
jgi:hypothetical protein